MGSDGQNNGGLVNVDTRNVGEVQYYVYITDIMEMMGLGVSHDVYSKPGPGPIMLPGRAGYRAWPPKTRPGLARLAGLAFVPPWENKHGNWEGGGRAEREKAGRRRFRNPSDHHPPLHTAIDSGRQSTCAFFPSPSSPSPSGRRMPYLPSRRMTGRGKGGGQEEGEGEEDGKEERGKGERVTGRGKGGREKGSREGGRGREREGGGQEEGKERERGKGEGRRGHRKGKRGKGREANKVNPN
ncbi:hypothetical protein EJ110_NYTH41948 [Nymphaea thermarum]|nr:hypothetical protein EJ110_NYTH41948 [Nymphaea thermarum]